jgi:cytochrome c oxidase subunit III
MKTQALVDVSRLPTYAYGNRGLMWWGTWGLIVSETTVFAGAVVAYFYLRELVEQWPPEGQPPSLLFGTLNLVILLLSGIPNHFTKKAAETEDLRKVRIGLLVCLGFSAAFLLVRAFEFSALNTRWDESAYGSIVYALMVLHTAHLVTDVIDSAVLTALMLFGPLEGRRFVDVSDNALYWWFVVAAWIPIYIVVYVVPRVT